MYLRYRMQRLKPIWIRADMGCHLLRIIRICPEIPAYPRRTINILNWLLIYSFISKITILIFQWWVIAIMLIVHYHLLIRNCRSLTIKTISPLHHFVENCLLAWLDVGLILLWNWLLIMTTRIVSLRKKISLGVHATIWLRLVSLKSLACKRRLHYWRILYWLSTASICLNWFPKHNTFWLISFTIV